LHPASSWAQEPQLRIRSISVVVLDIFENPTTSLFRQANSLKMSTEESIVLRELLFKEGDPYDEFIIEESLRNLRTLSFIRNVRILPSFDGSEVDIEIRVQDTWTLIPQASYSSGSGNDKRAIGLAETNLMGRGKRLEFLYQEDDSRESLAGVYDARRFMGYNADVLVAVFDREDGETFRLQAEKPFRTLLDEYSWDYSLESADIIGRLFEASDERYIFRREALQTEIKVTKAFGNPQKRVRRYSLGYRFSSEDFSQATEDDFDVLDLDPEVVSNDPAFLASNRRFSGPTFAFRSVEADFLSIAYIDRFSRVVDYNLGTTYGGLVHLAPEFLGSKDDNALLSLSRAGGMLLDEKEFVRAEISVSSRLNEQGFENTLFRSESRYYRVLGPLSAFDESVSLGHHTLAAAVTLDIGNELDLDRELLVGSDNFLRGYKARTFTGNKRYAVNLEDRIHLAENVWELLDFGMAFFADAGGAHSGSVRDLVEHETYGNIGVGLRVGFPRSSGERVLRFEIALPLRDGPDGSAAFEPRFLISGGQLFNSLLGTELRGTERATAEIGFDR
jgi:hypothetical protein